MCGLKFRKLITPVVSASQTQGMSFFDHHLPEKLVLPIHGLPGSMRWGRTPVEPIYAVGKGRTAKV